MAVPVYKLNAEFMTNRALISNQKSGAHRVVLIDGHSLLYRAYHALPKTFIDKEGRPTNAVYGFMSMLERLAASLKPDYLAVAFDEKGPTFRHQELVGYKEGRPEPEEDFIAQNPIIREVLAGFKIPVYSISGYEGEDIIATIAGQVTSNKAQVTKRTAEGKPDGLSATSTRRVGESAGLEIYIVSGDRDLIQLVNDQVKVCYPQKGLSEPFIYNRENARQVFGVPAEKIPDYKGLRGDPGDRIPGVFGIGEKTAADLIKAFGSVENIYKKLPKVKGEFGESVAKKLMEGAEMAVLSKKMATIVDDAPIKVELKDLSFGGFSNPEGLNILKSLGFRSLLIRLGYAHLVETKANKGRVKKTGPASSDQIGLFE